VAESLRLGLVANAPRADTVRLAPPLIVSDEQISEGVKILAAADAVAVDAVVAANTPGAVL
jgi:4-aminobutyrate aminotransferase-like enzyme